MKKLTEEEYIRINSAIHNEMSDEQMENFRLELEANPELNEEYQRVIQLNEGLKKVFEKEQEEEDLKAFFTKIHQELKEEGRLDTVPVVQLDSKPKSFSVYYRYAMAAGIVAVLGVSIWYFLYRTPGGGGTPIADDKPVKDTTIAPVASWQQQVDGFLYEATQDKIANIPSGLTSGVSVFEQQDYGKAIQMFRTAQAPQKPVRVPDKDSNSSVFGANQDSTTRVSTANDPVFESYRAYYTGLSHLLNGDSKQALSYLTKVKAPLLPEAEWYITLSYLKSGDPVRAKSYLDRILSRPDDTHFAQAQELSKNLKK